MGLTIGQALTFFIVVRQLRFILKPGSAIGIDIFPIIHIYASVHAEKVFKGQYKEVVDLVSNVVMAYMKACAKVFVVFDNHKVITPAKKEIKEMRQKKSDHARDLLNVLDNQGLAEYLRHVEADEENSKRKKRKRSTTPSQSQPAQSSTQTPTAHISETKIRHDLICKIVQQLPDDLVDAVWAELVRMQGRNSTSLHVLQAHAEADPQLAYMFRTDLIQLVISNDLDYVAYGVSVFLPMKTLTNRVGERNPWLCGKGGKLFDAHQLTEKARRDAFFNVVDNQMPNSIEEVFADIISLPIPTDDAAAPATQSAASQPGSQPGPSLPPSSAPGPSTSAAVATAPTMPPPAQPTATTAASTTSLLLPPGEGMISLYQSLFGMDATDDNIADEPQDPNDDGNDSTYKPGDELPDTLMTQRTVFNNVFKKSHDDDDDDDERASLNLDDKDDANNLSFREDLHEMLNDPWLAHERVEAMSNAYAAVLEAKRHAFSTDLKTAVRAVYAIATGGIKSLRRLAVMCGCDYGDGIENVALTRAVLHIFGLPHCAHLPFREYLQLSSEVAVAKAAYNATTIASLEFAEKQFTEAIVKRYDPTTKTFDSGEYLFRFDDADFGESVVLPDATNLATRKKVADHRAAVHPTLRSQFSVGELAKPITWATRSEWTTAMCKQFLHSRQVARISNMKLPRLRVAVAYLLFKETKFNADAAYITQYTSNRWSGDDVDLTPVMTAWEIPWPPVAVEYFEPSSSTNKKKKRRVKSKQDNAAWTFEDKQTHSFLRRLVKFKQDDYHNFLVSGMPTKKPPALGHLKAEKEGGGLMIGRAALHVCEKNTGELSPTARDGDPEYEAKDRRIVLYARVASAMGKAYEDTDEYDVVVVAKVQRRPEYLLDKRMYISYALDHFEAALCSCCVGRCGICKHVGALLTYYQMHSTSTDKNFPVSYNEKRGPVHGGIFSAVVTPGSTSFARDAVEAKRCTPDEMDIFLRSFVLSHVSQK